MFDSMILLARVLEQLKQFPKYWECSERVLSMSIILGDYESRYRALINFGNAALAMFQLPKAVETFSESLDLALKVQTPTNH